MNQTLQNLIKNGIPVSKAQFHSAVNNADQTPENYFSIDSEVPSRKVEMWYGPSGLVCHQKTAKSREDRYWIVPLPTIIFANFKYEYSEEDMDKIRKSAGITVRTLESESTETENPVKKRGRPFKSKID